MSAPTPLLTGSVRHFLLRAPRPIGARFSAQLDCLRWVAALLVCTTHLRALVFFHYQPELHPSAAAKLFYFMHGFGHEAVIIFFVLSGYLVGGETLRQLHRGEFDVWIYTLRRFTRLYPVYFAALLLGLVLDHAATRHLAGSGLYGILEDIPLVSYDVVSRLGNDTLLGNLLFCQGVLVPTYGSNVPLWSLANEAWYYALFPLLMVPLFAPIRPLGRISGLVLLALGAWFVRGQILLYFSVWLLGVLMHYPNRPLLRRAWPSLTCTLALMIALRTHQLDKVPALISDLGIAITLAFGLSSLSFADGASFPGAALHQRLAGFSYSLYLTHWPLGLFAFALCQHLSGHNLRSTLSARSLLIYILLLLFVYGCAWSLAYFTEHRTADLRKWLGSRLGLARAPVPPR